MSDASDTQVMILLVGVIGAALVGIHSWSKFDEPSYSTQSEYFARYKPRFATSSVLYTEAKLAYTGIVIALYVVLSTVPGLLAVFGVQSMPTGPSVPLFVALSITTLQSFPIFKDVEQKIRGFLHALARIPEGVRRAVSQMRVSPFQIPPAIIEQQTRKILVLCGDGINTPLAVGALLTEDDVLHTWSTTGALLTALTETNRPRTGIDPLFFDYYKDEFDSIFAKHGILAEQIAEHVKRQGAHDGPAPVDDPTLLRSARDLRDRLYTFVACGVISNARNAAQQTEILRALGFSIKPAHEPVPMIPLVSILVIAMLGLSIVTAFLVKFFWGYVLSGIEPSWQNVFPIPALPFETYTWSWSSAAFYLSTIIAALLIRNTRVARQHWFDMSNLDRERPIFLYAVPILVGTLSG